MPTRSDTSPPAWRASAISGQDLSLTWGVSQSLPLDTEQTLLAELGLAGYDSWQTTADHGSDASDGERDQVHAIGAQLGATYVP